MTTYDRIHLKGRKQGNLEDKLEEKRGGFKQL